LLSAQGVQFEHHDIAEDEEAAGFLRDRGIKTVPVVSVGDVVIIGFDEHRLSQVLGLDITPAADSTEWLAAKYEQVLDALSGAVQQLGQTGVDVPFEKRRMTVRTHVLHIASFAEGGWLSHRCGHFNIDDMMATAARCEAIQTVEEICAYTGRVRDDITGYLRRADGDTLERIVSSHYGGEVSVLEVMRIMLRHSAHHLRQLEWFMQSELGIDVDDRVAAAVTGITVPDELFAS
jgi:hypothetical protein